MLICVYAAASNDIDKQYIELSRSLGENLASSGHSLIYGGGGSGLMGAIAQGFHNKNGGIIGVVPKFMHNIEPIFTNCTSIITTQTMAERKEVMENKADAFIIIPGGIGTFDEFFQCITLKELGRHNKPIIVYNQNNYYGELLLFINHCIEKGFIKKQANTYFYTANTIEEIINYPPLKNDELVTAMS